MNAIVIILIAIIITFILIVVLKALGKENENYNAGSNIDFTLTKTDKNIPEAVLAKGDKYFPGGTFDYIIN